MTTSKQFPTQITCAGRIYTVDPLGWCDELHCWVTYNHKGEVVTIPEDDE